MKAATRFGWWLFPAALALFCYWPSLTTEFGVHNDYSVWDYDKSNVFFGHPESAHLAAIGRPLGAVLLNLQLHPIQTIWGFTISRWVAFFVTLLSAWLVMRHLERRVHVSRGIAACAAACVFMLPSSELFVFWVGNFVPGSLNVFIALLTYEVLAKVNLSNWRGGLWGRIKVSAYLLLAALLFISSMCIYPPTTLFILVPTFCSLVFSPIELWPQTRRMLLRDTVFTFVGVGGYFWLTRHVLRPVLGENFPDIQAAIDWNKTGLYQLAVESNVVVWIHNFWAALNVALDSFLHPYLNEPQSPKVAISLAAGLLVAAVWRFLRKPVDSGDITPRVQRGYLLQAGLAVLAVMALSECSVIVPSGTNGFVPYRVVYPISAMMILLLFSIVGRFRLPLATRAPAFIVRPMPVLILLGCTLLGHGTMSVAVNNAHNELAFFRQQLDRLDLRAVKGVTIIGPSSRCFYAEGPLRVDFTMLATKNGLVPGFTNVLLEERGFRRGEIPMRYRTLQLTDEYSTTIDDMAIIDMNEATCGCERAPCCQESVARVSASGEIGDTGNMLHAFDHELTSFWEAQGSNHWLLINYGRPYSLAEYSLTTMSPSERIPLDWQLLGSNDGSQWTVVDERHGESDWTPFEPRTFALAKPVNFSRYKLAITAVKSDIVRISEWTLRHESEVRLASQAKGHPN